MSMMPDMTEEISITVPGNTDQSLKVALMCLFDRRPELFAVKPHYRSTMWDAGFDLTPEGARFVANLIKSALGASAE